MKLALKPMVSSLLAAGVLTLSSISAFAVDYPTPPNYDIPTDAVIADGESENGKTAEKPADVVGEGMITSAEGDTVTVYVNDDSAVISKEAVSEMKKSGKTVEMVAPDYTLTVDPETITMEEPVNINLAMVIEKLDADKTVGNLEAEKDAVVIKPATKGEFGLTVSITLGKSYVAGLDVKNLKFYYVADDGKATLYKDAVKVNADETVTVSITHASQYVLTDKEIVPGDSENVAPDSNSDVPPTGVTLVVVPAALAGAALVASAIVIKKKNK